jgi:energy coupling factor transporter S component ThiW
LDNANGGNVYHVFDRDASASLIFLHDRSEHADNVFRDYGQQELHSGVEFLFLFKRKENSTMKQNNTTKKLALAGVLTALAIVGSFISVPVAGSKCAPVQHMVNILAAVTLGPAWGVGIAFCASLLRNLLGLGSLMAFPGSMVGALCCGLVYKKCHILSLTCLAEAIGTGFLGALAAYPVALYLMGIAPAGLFVYVVPFLISTVAGSILAFILITVLEKGGVMSQIKEA